MPSPTLFAFQGFIPLPLAFTSWSLVLLAVMILATLALCVFTFLIAPAFSRCVFSQCSCSFLSKTKPGSHSRGRGSWNQGHQYSCVPRRRIDGLVASYHQYLLCWDNSRSWAPSPPPGADITQVTGQHHNFWGSNLPACRARPSPKQAIHKNTTCLSLSGAQDPARPGEMPQLSRSVSVPAKGSTSSPRCQTQGAWLATSKHK